jgi:uncharacterized membrane protein YeaQ/YmgE (transglycosylase-associated protein family)
MALISGSIGWQEELEKKLEESKAKSMIFTEILAGVFGAIFGCLFLLLWFVAAKDTHLWIIGLVIFVISSPYWVRMFIEMMGLKKDDGEELESYY